MRMLFFKELISISRALPVDVFAKRTLDPEGVEANQRLAIFCISPHKTASADLCSFDAI